MSSRHPRYANPTPQQQQDFDKAVKNAKTLVLIRLSLSALGHM